MKKIINGKMYNTETAKHIGQYRADYSVTDFNYYTEVFLICQLFFLNLGHFVVKRRVHRHLGVHVPVP